LFALLLLPFAGSHRWRASGRQLRRLLGAVLIVFSLAATFALTGCGVNNGYFAQQPQNYSITVTATSGSIAHSTVVTLNVQ
jgi:hypothetical protein